MSPVNHPTFLKGVRLAMRKTHEGRSRCTCMIDAVFVTLDDVPERELLGRALKYYLFDHDIAADIYHIRTDVTEPEYMPSIKPSDMVSNAVFSSARQRLPIFFSSRQESPARGMRTAHFRYTSAHLDGNGNSLRLLAKNIYKCVQ